MNANFFHLSILVSLNKYVRCPDSIAVGVFKLTSHSQICVCWECLSNAVRCFYVPAKRLVWSSDLVLIALLFEKVMEILLGSAG